MTIQYDAVVVGGGPAGATAAWDLARAGRRVLLLDRAGRIKPCGGAIPPRMIRDFEIPDHLLVARATSARMVSPAAREVDMPVTGGGFVGMVDREVFDEWLRERAATAGAERRDGTFTAVTRAADGGALVEFTPHGGAGTVRVAARVVIGANGANSAVARQCVPAARKAKFVFAYHEIVRTPPGRDPGRCDIHYNGALSPDFYSWIFPHGPVTSIGTGSARKGFSLRKSVTAFREQAGLSGAETIRREGAPIPLKPLRRWDNGRDVVLAGDAAGVVAPASGEGLYYAMLGGRLAAQAADAFCHSGDAAALRMPRAAFMKEHGRVFLVLGLMQWFWYGSDRRREQFVKLCRDKDIQHMTWDSYMNKRLTRRRQTAKLRVFVKDMAHLLGFAQA